MVGLDLRSNSKHEPKISFVAKNFDVRVIKIWELFAFEKAVF